MASIIKRGPYQYQVRIRKKGFPCVTKTFTDRKNAQKWARKIEAEMEAGTFRPYQDAENTTLAEIIQDFEDKIIPTYKSQKKEKSKLNIIKKAFGHYSLDKITTHLVSKYRDKRLQQVKPKTVRNELNLLNRLLKYAMIDKGIELPNGLVTEKIRMPRVNDARERRLTAEEEKRLLNEAKKYSTGWMYYFIKLALETAMRRSELFKLTWHDINLKDRVAYLKDTKNGENRIVPLSPEAIKILKEMKSKYNKEKIKDISNRVFYYIKSEDTITHAFITICNKKRANIKDLRVHDLRHEATSRLFELGLDAMEVSTITGHKTLSMLKRYTHLKARNLAQKLAAL